MNWLTYRRGHPPGFRMDRVDGLVLAALILLSLAIGWHTTYGGIHWIPLYVGLTFFLFCNIFRIGNRLEPLWYLPFTAAAAYGLYTLDLRLFWLLVLWVLEPLKWILIGYRIIKGPYLGIFSRASAKSCDGSQIDRV